ncbi:hypothetical protein [Pseudomonas fluorescens]|uniref:hypothetical protein n=1 Tax=Pseudomonas fluorescens TaxID=294 RepID=UPI000F46E1BD|nr:hypothetical protein [Pseudomonas fluorescens]RON91846.1 hypothetical protein BK668_09600 [Pseudomonas fluorescens]
MPVFEILPLEAIGPARLGASRTAAREAMSACGFQLEWSNGRLDYFCKASIQLEYGPSDEVQFIGVSGNSQLNFTFKGVDVFAISAAELFSLMAASDDSGPHEFDRYEYCFPNQILTLWDADEQYDRQGGEEREVWGQVGIGNDAYAAAIAMKTDKNEL